ncbi:MAG: cation:proton antiporter [Planctomycetota bacterium]
MPLPALRDTASQLDVDPFLALGIVLALGAFFGALAKRVRVPSVTGQILAGFLIGTHGLRVVDSQEVLGALGPLSQFALALIAVEVGSHLNVRRLRNAGKRLTYLLVGELTLMPALVFGALVLLTPLGDPATSMGLSLALLMAALAIETSPATTVSLVREGNARGILTKTLLASVALSNIACIVVFEFARAGISAALERHSDSVATFFAAAFSSLGLSVALGAVVALALVGVTRNSTRQEARLVTSSLAAVILCNGAASAIGASPLLSCLALGLVQTNLIPSREKLVDSVLAHFLPAIAAVFFTLAGLKLDPTKLVAGGLVAGVLFASRIGAKLLVANVAATRALPAGWCGTSASRACRRPA